MALPGLLLMLTSCGLEAPHQETPRPRFSGATPAENLQVAPGFTAELIYSVASDQEGSWVSMTFDDRGRVIVSAQYGGLFRLQLGSRPGEDVSVEALDVTVGSAQGLLYAYDSLYVVINSESGSGFYRLQDSKGDDQFDQVTLLTKFEGERPNWGEHGPHAVIKGPDSQLYLVGGNMTNIPEDTSPQSPHRHWGEDLLLSRLPAANAHATGIMAPGGWIARTDPEGREWVLICAGFRNAYDIDFNLDGELFAYDSDMEMDIDSPWYKPTRILHAVSGADFGWRYGSGKWPAYYADSLGSVLDIGRGSPSGGTFGTGASFPAQYQRAFFALDWTYGIIYAVHLKPSGSSYTATSEPFVQGKPLPVADASVGPDGALYFITGGRRLQSGLYRVRYNGSDSTQTVRSTGSDSTQQSARDQRHRLEAFHGEERDEAVEVAWPYLGNDDRHLRHAARIALEHQNPERWREQLFRETDHRTLIYGLMALTRVGKKALKGRILEALNNLPLDQLSAADQLAALRTYALAFIRMGRPSSPLHTRVQERLDTYFPATDSLVNRELARLLTYLDSPSAPAKSMKLVASTSDEMEQAFYMYILAKAKAGWMDGLRHQYFSWFAQSQGRQDFASWADLNRRNILEEAIAGLKETEKPPLESVLAKLRGTPSEAPESPPAVVGDWEMADLAPILHEAEKGRSFEGAKSAYQVAQCHECHRLRSGGGGRVGPDLTYLGSRMSAYEILESILEPSRAVSDQYQQEIFQTRDGRTIVGMVVKDSEEFLEVQPNPLEPGIETVAKDAIESRRPSDVSAMPEDLINVLSREEVLDLLAYLRSVDNPNDRAFQK